MVKNTRTVQDLKNKGLPLTNRIYLKYLSSVSSTEKWV